MLTSSYITRSIPTTSHKLTHLVQVHASIHATDSIVSTSDLRFDKDALSATTALVAPIGRSEEGGGRTRS